MSLKDDIENAMNEGYGDRISSIGDLVDLSRDEVMRMIKNIDFKDWVDLLRALRDQDRESAREILGVTMEYNMGGTRSPAEMRAAKAQDKQQATAQDSEMVALEPTDSQVQQKRTQAMQRLGRNNLGGATAQQAASALGSAEKAKPLTPIQRKALATQAAQVDALASDPKTAMQFRQLLNRLNSGR